MKIKRSSLPLTAIGALMMTGALWGQENNKENPIDAAYWHTVRDTADMVQNKEAQKIARRNGLNVLNLTWEDTGRYKGSAVGPNISDLTIQVGVFDSTTRQFKVACMPVIRYPNFRDKTCDLNPGDFTLLVGNQEGHSLKRISLEDFLAEPTAYLSNPDSWKGKKRSLLCDRDSKVLVSAQACFLPVPKSGKATFNPVVFNYQSYSNDPAVLTVLATREGTSVTVVDNKRDAFESGARWGQRLFHNEGGRRASLTGQRISDYQTENDPPIVSDKEPPAMMRSGMNMVLLIQIPLKQKRPLVGGFVFGGSVPEKALRLQGSAKSPDLSDVEEAVIGHGEFEGPFTEIDNLAIERDTRYPVRVTVQFYKATSNGVVSESDLQAIKAQIDGVYSRSSSVGSLVTDGRTGRITEYEGAKVQPPDWWERFWERHQHNTGDSPEEAQRQLRELLGVHYQEQPVCDLYLRDLLRKKTRLNL